MSDHEERVAVLENAVANIQGDIKYIRGNQQEILSKYHNHEIESEHYKTLIDELIEEKKMKVAEAKSKVAARSAIVDKLIVAGIISSMGIILTLAWHGVIDKVTSGG